jgi:hypothetical protein
VTAYPVESATVRTGLCDVDTIRDLLALAHCCALNVRISLDAYQV